MKRFTQFLVALLLLAWVVPAEASWNIRQKGSGATVWTDGSVEVPTGDTGLVVYISSLATQVTHFVVTHKKGKLKKAYAIAQHGSFEAQSPSPSLTFGISTGAVPYFTPISTGASLSVPTAIKGIIGTMTPSDSRIDVDQGQVIGVKVGGSAVGTVAGVVVIVIE